jgi:ADP-ribose diphosphatase
MQLATRRIYAGRVITLDIDTVRFPDGSTGELEIVRHPGAAAVVPVASDGDGGNPTILMLRQFRYATGGTLWEVPAGTLGPGEDPAACARRELEEEAGVTAGRLEPLTTIWTTPGFTTEAIHLYWATALTATAARHERDEFIEVVPRPLSAVLEAIKAGEVQDAKSVVALLYFARFVQPASPT